MRGLGDRPHTPVNVYAPLLELYHLKKQSKCCFTDIARTTATSWTVCTLTLSTCSWLGLYTMWWRFVFVCIIPPHNIVSRIHLEVKHFISRMIGTLYINNVCFMYNSFNLANNCSILRLYHGIYTSPTYRNVSFVSNSYIFTMNVKNFIR